MRRQRLVPYCCLVALLCLGAAAVAAPAAADGTATTASDVRTVAQSDSNQTFNNTGFVALTRADDGSLYLAGISGNFSPATVGAGGNATLIKQAPDGSSAWTRTFPVGGSNTTSVFMAVEPGPNGGVYGAQISYNRSGGYSPPNATLMRVDAGGTVQWREPLPTGTLSNRRPLTATDSGIIVANRTRDGLELFRYGPDGDRDWTESYDVRPDRVSVDAVDDGYLLSGTVDFESPWLMRIDEAGTVQSNTTFPSTEIGDVADAVPTPDGGVVLVGSGSSFGGSASPVAVGVGPDDTVRWTRVVGSTGETRISDVLRTDDGFVLVGGQAFARTGPTETTLTGVGFDGAVQYRTSVPGFLQATVTPGPGDRLTLAGLTERSRRTLESGVRTVALPSPDPDASAELEADAGIDSGDTSYRGQNLLIQSPRRAGETVEIVSLPDEYDDFEPHVARHVTLDRNGRAVVETASLAEGRYVVEIDDEPVLVESGSVVTTSGREDASFELQSHDIYSYSRGSEEGQFVDRAAGEETATLTWDSSRRDYVAQVSVSRFRGDAVSESTLEAFLGGADGFTGTTTVNGVPVALIESGEEMEVDASVTALDPGMYDVRIGGADTSEVGDSETTRVVVGTTERRPLSVSIGDEPVEVSVGNETERNITISGVTHGVAAASMSANVSGQPLVDLNLGVDINGTRSSGSAGRGPDYAEAGASSLGGDTANGTITLGTLGVGAEPREIDPDANTTNTVTFGIDWVVDERGIPYTVPDSMAITVEVSDIEDATGETHERPPRPRPGASAGAHD
jgi:hypothetical protein